MNWLFFGILSLVFLLSPYWQGLYFISDFYSVSLILTVLFFILALRIFLYKEISNLKAALLVFLLPLCQLVSLFVAESPEGAWNEFIRWSTYAFFFILVFWISKHEQIRKWLPLIFQITGVWLALYMLFVYFGWINDKSAFIDDRFSSVLQYPNTFGLIMAVLYLFSLANLMKQNQSKLHTFIYAFPLVLFMINLILSYSRGMMMIFPVIWLIGLMFIPLKRQVLYISYTLISCLAAFIVYIQFSDGNFYQEGNPGIISLIISVLISTIIIFLIEKALSKLQTSNKRWVKITESKIAPFFLPMFILFLGVALVLDLLFKGLFFQMLPDRLQTRIDSISFTSDTAMERIFFLEDALKMSADSPLIGFGGQGWATLYENYQQTPYVSNKIHNGYAEWLIDLGWIGFGIYIAIFVFLFYHIFQRARKEKENSLYVAVLLSLLAIITHSFFDFNFSYGTIWFMTFWLIAIGFKDGQVSKPFTEKVKVPNAVSYSIVGLLSILALLTMIMSYRYMIAAQSFDMVKETDSLAQKIKLSEKAVSYHENNIEYNIALADLYVYAMKNQHGVNLTREVSTIANRMVTLEPHNSSVLNKATLLYGELGDWNKSIKYLDAALDRDNFNKILYENSIHIKTKQALHIYDHHRNEALRLAQSAIEDYEQLTYWLNDFNNKNLGSNFNSRNFSFTNEIYYYSALSYVMMNEFDRAIDLYQIYAQTNEEKDDRIEALAIFLYKITGDNENADQILENSVINHEMVNRLLKELESKFNKR